MSKEAKEKKEPVQILPSKIKEMVEKGKTREDIAKDLGLSKTQTLTLLKELKLNPKRKTNRGFVIVQEETEATESLKQEVLDKRESEDKDLLQVPNKETEQEW